MSYTTKPTDAELAHEARQALAALEKCATELKARGYDVYVTPDEYALSGSLYIFTGLELHAKKAVGL